MWEGRRVPWVIEGRRKGITVLDWEGGEKRRDREGRGFNIKGTVGGYYGQFAHLPAGAVH